MKEYNLSNDQQKIIFDNNICGKMESIFLEKNVAKFPDDNKQIQNAINVVPIIDHIYDVYLFFSQIENKNKLNYKLEIKKWFLFEIIIFYW